ncbi:MAG: hypothetical protein K2J80_13330 [Oscillospiraceae bacterium]|nr:hypothetical protein [Oscillospiraceae bacterium]
MSTKPTPKFAYGKWKFLFLAAYFVILTTERAISLIKCCFGDFRSFGQLDYYMMMLTIFAIFGSYIFAVIRCTDVVKNDNKKDIFSELSIAAGILLLGGMVHTGGSIPAMQFIAYGMILISMAIHTAQNVKKSKNADRKWLSFAYIVSYSMAIPVVYYSDIDLAYLFIPIECVVSAGMVAMFTIMLTRFYHGNGESNFSLLPFMIALFGDFTVLFLRWEEKVNVFVLIFLCVTTVLWFAGNVMCIKKKETKQKPADHSKK